jgi:hypothetical protein
MTKIDGESLRNNSNSPDISMAIKEYFNKYPNSAPRECCRQLGLDYRRYNGRVRKIKHDLKIRRQSISPVTHHNHDGRSLKPLVGIHRQEYRFAKPVPEDFVLILEERAQPCRVEKAWYRSPNRNRQLEYFNDYVSIRVYPKSGTCRILPHRTMPFDELRVKVEDVFAKVLSAKDLLSETFDHMINGLQVARRHRTFCIGPVTPFRIGFYRESHGLAILADRSHPEHLEVHESWPTWLSPLLEHQRNQDLALENNTKVVGEFSSQIRSHLHVMEGIGLAADRLDEATRNLVRAIDSWSNKKERLPNPPSKDSVDKQGSDHPEVSN